MKKLGILSAAVMVALSAPSAIAKVTDAEAAKLGTELTPMGGVKAANADGSIPAWDGGITSAIAGDERGCIIQTLSRRIKLNLPLPMGIKISTRRI